MYLYLDSRLDVRVHSALLVFVLVLTPRPKVLEKYQVHSSTNKYIVYNKKNHTLHIDSRERFDESIG